VCLLYIDFCLHGRLHYVSDHDYFYFNCRRGQCYIVPVGEAPKYLDDGFKLVMSFPTRKDRDQIYITFQPKSTFTKEDVWKYFRYCRLILVHFLYSCICVAIKSNIMIFLPANMVRSVMCKFHFGRNACLVM
jgi:hypothetical protein